MGRPRCQDPGSRIRVSSWLPGPGDGLSTARTRAAACAGTASIRWAPAPGEGTAGRSRAGPASCRPGGTLEREGGCPCFI